MSSQMLGRVLRENLERRIREIERQIEKYRQKYGMDFDEFFELVESNIGKLLDRGFDLGEVLEDSLIWEDLLDELDELKKKIKPLK
jgi:chromosome segregation ATPase